MPDPAAQPPAAVPPAVPFAPPPRDWAMVERLVAAATPPDARTPAEKFVRYADFYDTIRSARQPPRAALVERTREKAVRRQDLAKRLRAGGVR